MQEFVIVRKWSDGSLWEQGRVTFKQRCVANARLKDHFPPVTRSYEEILKGCRFLALHLPAKLVHWKLTNRRCEVIIYRLEEYLSLI